jgi:hypothetical protein
MFRVSVCFVFLLSMCLSKAEAAPVTILNPSFETSVSTLVAPSNWLFFRTTTATSTLRSGTIVGTGITPAAAQGNNWAFLDSRRNAGNQLQGTRGITQSLGASIQANSLYTFALTVGSRTGVVLPNDFTFGLFTTNSATVVTGNRALAVANGLSTSGAASTARVSLTFDSTGSSLVGQNLVIGLNIPATAETAFSGATAVAHQVLFDDLSLDVTAVPEPASALLVSMVAVAAGVRRRIRRNG